jgi:hypothetical protein
MPGRVQVSTVALVGIRLSSNRPNQSAKRSGVALLGSLLGSGRALSLHVPLAVAAGGYLVALALAWTAIRSRS